MNAFWGYLPLLNCYHNQPTKKMKKTNTFLNSLNLQPFAPVPGEKARRPLSSRQPHVTDLLASNFQPRRCWAFQLLVGSMFGGGLGGGHCRCTYCWWQPEIPNNHPVKHTKPYEILWNHGKNIHINSSAGFLNHQQYQRNRCPSTMQHAILQPPNFLAVHSRKTTDMWQVCIY